MLGLGVFLGIAKKAYTQFDSLFGALKARSTYYENDGKSRSEVSRISSAGILDNATILLTPTAYSDARVHSVKTYTGNELVTNGDFSDGRNDWTNNASATLSTENDKLKVSISGAGSGYGQQNITGLTIGATYKISAEGEIGTSTRLALYTPNAGFNNLYADGAISTFFTATSTTENLRLYVYDDGAYGFWDNVSVIDVSSDFDFDRASSATRINSSGLVQDMQSITDPELVLNGDFEELGDELVTNGDFATDSDWIKQTGWSISNGKAISDGSGNYKSISQSCLVSPIGKTYKVTYEVSDYVIGEVRCILGGFTLGQIISSNGLVTEYLTVSNASSNTFVYLETRGSGFTGSIDNVSVKQVDPNDRWSLGTGWSIEDGKLVAVAPSSSDVASQAFDFEDGGTYKFTFEISDYSSGDVYISKPYDGSADKVGANGTHTFYYVAGSDNAIEFKSDSSFRGSIDNVSIKHVSFEEDNVDLARINYDSNGENGHILLEPTSTNLFPYSEDFENQWTAQSGITITNNTTETTSPSGEYNASKVVSTDNTKGFSKTGLSITANATRTIYLKGSVGGESVTLKDGSGNGGTETYSLTTDWVRYELKTTADGSTYQGLFVDNISVGTIYAWGAQIEELPYATSYIPNHGTAVGVTRAAETLTGSGNSTLINSTEGVLYAEIAALADDSDIKGISLGKLGTNVTTNGVAFYFFDNNLRARGYDSDYTLNGGIYFEATKTSINTNTFYKVAISWDSNGGKMYVDGALITPTRNLSGYGFAANYFNSLNFYRNSNDVFEGKCKALAVFNEALSDTELENLTS